MRLVGCCLIVLAACGGDDREGVRQDVEPEVQDEVAEVAEVEAVDEAEAEAVEEIEAEVEAEAVEEVEVEVAEVEVVVEVVEEIDCGDCDDGLDCTNDVCGADGVCQHHARAGWCKVAGTCVEAGDGPAECRICVPDVNPNGLTSLSGGPCNDNDPCTTDEQCTAGTCQGGIVRPCEASSICHTSLGCDKDLGCVEAARAEGTPCGDGQACELSTDEAPVMQCVEGDGMPTGSIAWFDALRCPTGWERYDAATGRTLVPVGPLGPVGALGEDGVPLTSGVEPTHRHTATGQVNIGAQRFAGIAGGGNPLANAGTVDFGGTSDASGLNLPYVQLLACRKTTDHVLGAAPTGVFVFADGALGCGADWVASDEGADRLVVGVPDGGSAGATFGAPAGLSVRASHSHAVSGYFAIDSHGIALASGCCSADFASSSDPLVEVTSSGPDSSDATTFPWRAELQCMAPESIATVALPDTAPPGIVLFAADDTCPMGWSPLASARGHIIVGAATGGDVGVLVGNALGDREDRVHRHNVTLALTLSQRNIAAANGPNNDGAAPGMHDATLTMGPATSGLPFRQLLACVK